MPEKLKQQGQALNLNPGRVYGSSQEKEAKQPEGKRIDTKSIVMPDHMQFRSGMDREQGAEEACTHARAYGFKPPTIAFEQS